MSNTNNERAIVLDTETTGFHHAKGDRIVEIGAVELIGNMESGRTYHTYLTPYPQKVDPGALVVHGLTDEFLSTQPKFRNVVDDFLEFIGDAPLIIHNAPFDMAFLNMEMERARKPAIHSEIRDTLRLARLKYPAGQRVSLDALCSRFDIDTSERSQHGGLLDARLLAQVYVKMLELDRLALHVEEPNIKPVTPSILSFPRRARQTREIILPSPQEYAAHESFIKTSLKDSLWGKLL